MDRRLPYAECYCLAKRSLQEIILYVAKEVLLLKWGLGTTITYIDAQFENGWIVIRQVLVDKPMLQSVSGALATILVSGLLIAGAAAAEGVTAGGASKPRILGRLAAVAEPLIDQSEPLGKCADEAKHPEIKVTITNVRNSEGNLRLSLYGDEPKEWLEKGMKLLGYDIPAQTGEMIVCMVLPRGNGVYGLAMLHDENMNGKTEIFSEGYGFSNNAKAFLKAPGLKKTAFTAEGMRTELIIQLRY